MKNLRLSNNNQRNVYNTASYAQYCNMIIQKTPETQAWTILKISTNIRNVLFKDRSKIIIVHDTTLVFISYS